MTFKIPDITLDVGHFFNMLMHCVRGFACTWMAPRVGNPSPNGLATLDPQDTCHGPRPGPKPACGIRAGSLRATEPRARGKTRGRKRKKCRRAGSPPACVWREIAGVTRVDEKGHKGNTAVVTAYLCWRKHGQRNSRTGVPGDYYYLL